MALLDKLNFHTVLRQSKGDEIAQSQNTLCGAAGALMDADSQRIQQLNDAARQTFVALAALSWQRHVMGWEWSR